MIFYIFQILFFIYSNTDVLLDKIVAIVGNEIICLSDLNKRFEHLSFMAQDLNKLDKNTLLNNMINELLIKQYLNEKELLPSEEDVLNSITSIRTQYGFSETDFRKKLEVDGISYAMFKEAREKDLYFRRFFELELKNYVNIKETDIETFYKNSLKKDPRVYEYNLKHILVKDEALAKEIFKQINSNNFEEFVAKYSMDEMTKYSGGELGYLDSESLNIDLFNALANMSVKDVKGPVKTKIGYQIIKLEDVKFSYSKDFIEKLPSLKMQLIELESQKQLSKWAEERKELSYVKIFI